MGGIGIWQLLIVAVIVVLLFGTNKLRTLGSDLGASIKGFKKAIGDEDKTPPSSNANSTATSQDADFKSITEQAQPEVKKDESKSQNKEQV